MSKEIRIDYPYVMASILKVLYEKGDISELVFPKKIIREALSGLEKRDLIEKGLCSHRERKEICRGGN